MQDPFYHKEKRRKKTRMLAADAWLDSALYDFGQSLGRGYTQIEDFFSRFRVSGFRRFFVEIFSDAFSFAAIGMVLVLLSLVPFAVAGLGTALDYSDEVPKWIGLVLAVPGMILVAIGAILNQFGPFSGGGSTDGDVPGA